MTHRAPVIFVGHGSPMNAISNNAFTQSLAKLGELYPNPKAILCVSAHWMTEGTWVTRMPKPRTIHDFDGFPEALYAVRYPAPGSPEIADLVCETILKPKIHPDNEMWGLDHGCWSVLRHMFPKADIPVLQLSLNLSRPASYHFDLGEKLRPLRDQGILIVGSGNIVHNLSRIKWEESASPYDWARVFDEWMKAKLLSRDSNALVNEYANSEAGKLSVPTAEHYLPLLYTIGAADKNDQLKFAFEGIQNASISMRTFSYG